MYESPTKDLTPKEIVKVAAYAQAMAKVMRGTCMHLPARMVYRTIKVRDSLRLMDICEGCYGIMDRAGCIAEVI